MPALIFGLFAGFYGRRGITLRERGPKPISGFDPPPVFDSFIECHRWTILARPRFQTLPVVGRPKRTGPSSNGLGE